MYRQMRPVSMASRRAHAALPALAVACAGTGLLCAAPVRAQNAYLISDYDTNTISRVGLGGGAATTFISGVTTPVGIATDSSGNIYVASLSTGDIAKYSSSGALINASYLTGLDAPYDLAFNASGDLLVSNFSGSTVSEYSPSGALLNASYISGLAEPTGLAFDSTGNIYIANGDDEISKYTSTGALVTAAFVTGVSFPAGIAFNSAGDLFVASNASGTIGEYSSTGSALNSDFSSAVASPIGLLFTSSGNLLAASNTGDTVYSITPGGTATPFITGVSDPQFMVAANLSAAAPEPTGLLLILPGGIGLLASRRRARRRAPSTKPAA